MENNDENSKEFTVHLMLHMSMSGGLQCKALHCSVLFIMRYNVAPTLNTQI